MRTAEIPIPRDPDFDRPPRSAPPGPGPSVIHFYQRLVVNPFLGVMTFLVASGVAILFGLEYRLDLIFGTIAAGILIGLLLLQFHCLDCGKTGWFCQRRRHLCPRIMERWQTPFSSASHHFPLPGTQLFLWFLAMSLAGVVWLCSRL